MLLWIQLINVRSRRDSHLFPKHPTSETSFGWKTQTKKLWCKILWQQDADRFSKRVNCQNSSNPIQNYQRDALNIIYSSNIITLLYMFRVPSTHPQKDIVVHKQHMVPSLSIRVLVSCWYAAIGRTPYSCISTRH